MKRREFIALLGGAAAWPLAARAQQPDRMRRIGVLMNLAADDREAQARIAAFLQGLQQLGWTDGGNVRIDYRWAAGDTGRFQRYAEELLALAPDVILASAFPSVQALQRATRTAPIVFAHVSDPVASGFVQSLARPGGNTTGFMQFEFGLSGKWLELLKQVAPDVTRAAVLRDPDVGTGTTQFAVIQAMAPLLRVEVNPVNVRDPSEIRRAVEAFARSPNGGLIVTASALALHHGDLITMLAARHRLPAVYWDRSLVAAGGLISYGVDPSDQYRRAAGYVDRILKGAKPADLPVQAPTKYECTSWSSTSRPPRRSASTCRRCCLRAPTRLLDPLRRVRGIEGEEWAGKAGAAQADRAKGDAGGRSQQPNFLHYNKVCPQDVLDFLRQAEHAKHGRSSERHARTF